MLVSAIHQHESEAGFFFLNEQTGLNTQGPSRKHSGPKPPPPFSTVLQHTAELAVMNDTLFSRDVSIRSLKYLIESSGAVWT